MNNQNNDGLPEWYKAKHPNWIHGVWLITNPDNDKQFISVSHGEYVNGFTYTDYINKRKEAEPVSN